MARKEACDLTYAINLSEASLSDEGLLDVVRGQFLETGVPPETICFEITETEAIANIVFISQEPVGRLSKDRRQLRAGNGN